MSVFNNDWPGKSKLPKHIKVHVDYLIVQDVYRITVKNRLTNIAASVDISVRCLEDNINLLHVARDQLLSEMGIEQ